jgi:hypothetical protein
MVTRRDLMTGSALGALAAAPPASAAQRRDEDEQTAAGLKRLGDTMESIDRSLETAFQSNRVTFGFLVKVREYFTQYMRANGKFPDYMEVGINVFYEIYDWHIKNNRQMEVSRVLENRMAIRFMFTLMILRQEQDPNYVGVPYDR